MGDTKLMRYFAMTLSTILVMILTGSPAFAQYPEPDTAPAQTQGQAPAPSEPAQAEEPATTPSEPAAAPAEEAAPSEPAEKAEEPAAAPSEPAAAPAEEAAPSEPAEKAEEPAATPSEPAAAPAEEPAPAEAPAEKADTPSAAPALTASDVDGLNVVDSAGKELGKVVGVNEADGKVTTVEVESSGILGTGFFATTYVLPIDKISKDGDKLSASITGKEAEAFKMK